MDYLKIQFDWLKELKKHPGNVHFYDGLMDAHLIFNGVVDVVIPHSEFVIGLNAIPESRVWNNASKLYDMFDDSREVYVLGLSADGTHLILNNDENEAIKNNIKLNIKLVNKFSKHVEDLKFYTYENKCPVYVSDLDGIFLGLIMPVI